MRVILGHLQYITTTLVKHKYMKTLYKIFVTIYFLLFAIVAEGQTWEWARGGSGYNSSSGAVFGCTDKMGSLIISGINSGDSISFGQINIHNSHSSCALIYPPQTLLVKYDSSGNVMWAKGSRASRSSPIGVATDLSGNTYLFGFYDNCDTFGFDSYTVNWNHYTHGTDAFFLAKFSVEGTVEWIRNGAYVGMLGATSWLEYIKSGGIGTDNAGNVYISGVADNKTMYFGNDSISNSAGIGGFVAKYDSLGNLLWAKSINDSGLAGVKMMRVKENGDLYLAGRYTHSALKLGNFILPSPADTEDNIFITKLDSSGNIIWAKNAFGFTSQSSAYVTTDIMGLGVDDSRRIYISGTFMDSIRYGNTTLINTYPGFSYLYPPPLNTFFMILDSSGNILSSKIFGMQGWSSTFMGERAYGLSIDNCNDIWICGSMDTNIVFDGHLLNAPSNSIDPKFIVKLDSTGTVLEYFALPTGGYTEINAAISNGQANDDAIYISGGNSFGNALIIGNNSINPLNLFVAKYNTFCTAVQIKQQEMKHEISLYPNPAYNQFTINYPGIKQNAKADLYNITGQLVYSTLLKEENTIVNTSSLAPGIYVCKIMVVGEVMVTRKVVKE